MPDTGPLRPALRRRPIFIVGAQESGSTQLRLILDSHDNIAIPQETGFMRAYNAHQYIPHKWSGRDWAKRMGWSRKELDEELAAFYRRIFARHVERQGKQRWGDKDAVPHLARRRDVPPVPRRGVHRDRAPSRRQRRVEHDALRPCLRKGGEPCGPLHARAGPTGLAPSEAHGVRPLRGTRPAARAADARAA